MQRHIVDVVARAVRIVRIIVVRLVHSRRLAVEKRRQFLKQTKGFFFTYEFENRVVKIYNAAFKRKLANLSAHVAVTRFFLRYITFGFSRRRIFAIIPT